MKKRNSFTLIELLASVAIIAILAGLTFGGYTFARNRARESATESLLKQLEAGFNSAKIKVGYCPSTMSGTTKAYYPLVFEFNTDATLQSIKINGTAISADLQKEFCKIVDLETIRKNVNDNGILEDAWGAPIYYAYPGVINKTGIDLISAGPDGKFGSGNLSNPINTWNRAVFYDNNEKIVDDLTNF